MTISDSPATKQDLHDAISELKQFVIERELAALRWVITIQVTYFFGTFAVMWFLLSNFTKT